MSRMPLGLQDRRRVVLPNGKYITRERTRPEVIFLNSTEGHAHLQPDTDHNDQIAIDIANGKS